MNIAIFLLFALPIGSAIAKGIFGKKLGSLVTGGAVGTLAFVVTTSLVIAGCSRLRGFAVCIVLWRFNHDEFRSQ
jgi:uncharacterized protein